MHTKRIFTFILTLFITVTGVAQDGKQLVAEMIEAAGGKQNFYELNNVTYDYEYRNSVIPITLVNHETYVFDKELSYAAYTEHSMSGANGEKVIEGYDGTETWVMIDGKLTDNEQANGFAKFIRKTNYYWFAMFFKLLDDGVNHTFKGSKNVNGKEYNLVEIGFGKNIGEVQDTYLLYINKETKLIDQFLFTIRGFGIEDPHLMVMEYETIDGIKIASKRKYITTDWDGNIVGDQWITTNWTNIKFNTDIDKSKFQKPTN
ncbi:MAG: hypothetical protein AAFO99_14355 [Bacteroidota bacterium]